jgi:outer membrane receptor protein involved in Fe transport
LRRAIGPAATLLIGSATGVFGQTAVQEVTVTAKAPSSQSLLDRKVYAVTQNLQSQTGTAADVLNEVPSISVDADGNPSVRGDPNVTILIDGKPSAEFAGATRGLSLQQMSASDIARIEVLTNPPAQYKAEGSGGVINIITRRSHQAGLSGGAQLNVGNHRRYNLNANLAYNAGKLALTVAVGLRQDTRERQIPTDRLAIDPVSGQRVQSRETFDEHVRRHTPSFKLGLDYQLDANETVGVLVSSRELYGGARFFDQQDFSGPPMAAPTSIATRHSDGHEWNISSGEAIHFNQKLWRPDETLSLAFQRSVTRERERYVYADASTLPPAPPAFSDLRPNLDLVKLEFGADYDLPLPQGREIKLGYDLEDDRNGFDNIGDFIDPITRQPTIDPGVTNHFRYHQQVSAGYGQYEQSLRKWRLQAGVRVEATKVSSLQITGDVAGGRRELAAYPSLHLERDVGPESRVSISLGRRVTRPDPEALNPFIDRQNIFNLRAGNAALLPQDTWLYELGYESKWKSLTYAAKAYYRFDRDSVTSVTQVVSADVVLTTQANLPKSKSGGVEFSAGGKLLTNLSFNLSGNAFHSQIDARALGAPGLESTTGIDLKASLDYRPTAADTAQVSFSRTSARLTPQGSIAAINLVNIGYRRLLRPDLALVVTLSDALNGQRFRRFTATPQLHDDYLRYQVGQIAYVGLTYTFGGQKKPRPAAFDYDQ